MDWDNLIAMILGAGGTSIAASIVLLYTARSLKNKTNAEASKTNAEALKTEKEAARVARSQELESLSVAIEQLSQENARMYARITDLEKARTDSRIEIDALRERIADLEDALRERDRIIEGYKNAEAKRL